MVKRRKPADGADGGKPDRLFDEDFYSSYPALWEFLTESCYEGGGKRELGTVSLFKDGDVLKACLSDRDVGEVAFVSGSSFKAVLDAMEQGLCSGGLDWRGQKRKGK